MYSRGKLLLDISRKKRERNENININDKRIYITDFIPAEEHTNIPNEYLSDENSYDFTVGDVAKMSDSNETTTRDLLHDVANILSNEYDSNLFGEISLAKRT